MLMVNVRAVVDSRPGFRTYSVGPHHYVSVEVGPAHITTDDPAELARLAELLANAAEVLAAQQLVAKCCPAEVHDAMKNARTFRAATVFVAHQDDGDGGTLELRNCKCGGTLAMDKAELDAAEMPALAAG